MLLPDLEDFRPTDVFKNGKLVVEGGKVLPFPRKEVPVWVRNTVRNAPVAPEDLSIPHGGGRIRVIEIVAEQLLTKQRVEDPLVEDGNIVADPSRDFAKIVVVERHHATGRVGKGFVTGFGLKEGAFASTVAHDAHNIVVVGMNDADMIACIDRLGETGGGIVAALDGAILAELPLPVAGLLSDQPIETVLKQIDETHAAVAGLGVTIPSPFMTLSFLALSVIPALKITDRGLIDVDAFEIVPLEV
jgi:adenine deaminase